MRRARVGPASSWNGQAGLPVPLVGPVAQTCPSQEGNSVCARERVSSCRPTAPSTGSSTTFTKMSSRSANRQWPHADSILLDHDDAARFVAPPSLAVLFRNAAILMEPVRPNRLEAGVTISSSSRGKHCVKRRACSEPLAKEREPRRGHLRREGQPGEDRQKQVTRLSPRVEHRRACG